MEPSIAPLEELLSSIIGRLEQSNLHEPDDGSKRCDSAADQSLACVTSAPGIVSHYRTTGRLSKRARSEVDDDADSSPSEAGGPSSPSTDRQPSSVPDRVRFPKRDSGASSATPRRADDSAVTVPLFSRDSTAPAVMTKNPFQCELVTKSSAKGFYESRYADVALSMFGCVVLDAGGGGAIKSKRLLGQACAYYRLGTALVITGVVVAVMDGYAQVTPDRGQLVPMEWIPFGSLYEIPPNLSDVRREVRGVVEAILAGDSTQQTEFRDGVVDDGEEDDLQDLHTEV